MQMCCNWAWRRWSQELVAPVDFTAKQELCGGGLIQFWGGKNGIKIQTVILLFCELKPKQWAEGSAAVVWRSLRPFPAPGMRRLKFEGWLHPRVGPFSLMVPLCRSFCGFDETRSLCQGDVLLPRGEQKSCRKGGVWKLLEQHHMETKRWIFVTVVRQNPSTSGKQ